MLKKKSGRNACWCATTFYRKTCKVYASAGWVTNLSQIPGQTRRATRIRQEIGAREKSENRPNSWAVMIARGMPTTTSKVPAVRPTTRIHSLGCIKNPTVKIPHPSMANQCDRCTRAKNGAPMVMMRLKLAMPFIRQKTQAIPARKPNIV